MKVRVSSFMILFVSLARYITIIILSISVIGCQMNTNQMEPKICYTPTASIVVTHPSAFTPLTPCEEKQEWAHELILGDAFARELDLYRAITCYKRAKILIPPEAIERRLQLDYDIISCYYLGHKYQDAINTFESSDLTHANAQFPAFNNLLIMLYESYNETDQYEKANALLEIINKCSPETALDLTLFLQLKEGYLEEAEQTISLKENGQVFGEDLCDYYTFAKSPKKARFLNAILPGAGYYYVGQKNSAITSFIINTIFIAATYQFIHHGYYAAGAITGSMEIGWYLGGINGAGIEAEEYNTRLYEGVVKNTLIKNNLFPILMFETTF